MAFGREESPVKSPVRGSDELIIFMGKGVEIVGDIRFQGSGRLDGKVDGKINVEGTLILGEGAMVSSEIEGGAVIVGGTVKGKITAHQKVQLLKTSVVNCDIVTPSLVIEEGAQFNGTAKTAHNIVAEKAAPSVSVAPEENKRKTLVQAVK